jgi:hypothetical protein
MKVTIIYFDEKIAFKDTYCYGYDFSKYYANCLGNPDMMINCIPKNHNEYKDYPFKIPIKKGKWLKYEELDFYNLKYGSYKVKITYTNPDIHKVFMLNKDDTYTFMELSFLYKYKEMFNITFTLITDIEYNVYIYEDKDVINASKIFTPWFKFLTSVEKSNMLHKGLLSKLAGVITKFDKHFFNEEDLDNLDISYLDDEDNTEYKILEQKDYYNKNDEIERTLFTTVISNKPYSYPLARIKPYLMAFSRIYIAEMIIKENLLDNVLRIHTDGIVLSKPHNFELNNIYYPIVETKSSGILYWNNVNCYYHHCIDCDELYKYKDTKTEFCLKCN